MNEELNYWSTLFKVNKLSLNASKTKFSIPQEIKKHKPIGIPPLHTDNVSIKRELVAKLLGVFLGENVSSGHISIKTQISNSNKLIYRSSL